jgi:hypothetical protein
MINPNGQGQQFHIPIICIISQINAPYQKKEHKYQKQFLSDMSHLEEKPSCGLLDPKCTETL